MLHHLLLCWFCLVLHVVCQPDDYVYGEKIVNIPVIIFNAFPQDDVTAFIAFEEARIERIPYGEHAHKNVLLEANDDFLFEYRKRFTEGIQLEVFRRRLVYIIAYMYSYLEAVLNYTGYGFIGSIVGKYTEILIILSQISAGAVAPLADPIAFETNLGSASKLYIYNAVTTTNTLGTHLLLNVYFVAIESVGLNFYSLYLRRNSDGSESESIATLTTALGFLSGIDVSVEPNLVTQIKVVKN